MSNLRTRLRLAVSEAARWRQFAEDSQKALSRQQEIIDEMEAVIRGLMQPRVGCADCEYTGLVAIDRIDSQTGEVTAVWESCPVCREAIDQFIDSWGNRLTL